MTYTIEVSPPHAVAALPIIRLEEGARPWLAGSRCRKCAVVVAGDRVVCPSCGGRGTLDTVSLALHGKLYNYTIVHRSFPGVVTPFISAIVDLDGGGTIKGTLLDLPPAVKSEYYDIPVRIVFKDTGQRDKEGRSFISYYFQVMEVPRHG